MIARRAIKLSLLVRRCALGCRCSLAVLTITILTARHRLMPITSLFCAAASWSAAGIV
jgi:hypothetical protein